MYDGILRELKVSGWGILRKFWETCLAFTIWYDHATCEPTFNLRFRRSPGCTNSNFGKTSNGCIIYAIIRVMVNHIQPRMRGIGHAGARCHHHDMSPQIASYRLTPMLRYRVKQQASGRVNIQPHPVGLHVRKRNPTVQTSVSTKASLAPPLMQFFWEKALKWSPPYKIVTRLSPEWSQLFLADLRSYLQ